MGVITLSRQTGTSGEEIARQVARALDMQVVDREIISEEMGSEAVDHSLERVLGSHLGIVDRVERLQRASRYLDAISTALLDVARVGRAVILGRGAQVVLQEWPDAVHVKVVGSFSARVTNMVRMGTMAEENIEQYLRGSDERRRAFHLELYGVDWDDPGLYDLIVNPSRTGMEGAVGAIVALARARGLVGTALIGVGR